MADDMFDNLSSPSKEDNNNMQEIDDAFGDNMIQENNNFGQVYGEQEDFDKNYFNPNYYNNQQMIDEQPEQPPQYLYQQSSIGFPIRPLSVIEQNEQQNQPNLEINKVQDQLEEEQAENIEMNQQQELLELCNDHLLVKDEEDDKEIQIKSQNDMKPNDEPEFFQQEFQDIYQAASQVIDRQVFCFPPPYFRNFITPKQMAPPSLEVIQKNKQYFSLGYKMDFSSVYQKPNETISSEEKADISTVLTPNKNLYDVMQEIMSSIMNKSVEILKHSQQGGQQLNDYISEMELLVKKFAILCKMSKIKFAKLEVMKIFENEKALFQKSADQINTSISQIKRFKESLKINEIINSKNPVI
ncbi:hypothetical protein TTHERM_00147570 (macronuclear) [Tetrahymena thermophila SB210]|uniref:Uncharacterized protein n=1 Tax=Tetrahymena thermophila (strain SB210) TaxID=312017 RepID=I7M2T1_TETTS|nr:hypothetical protein TTHERM_00147570 [Tetrahymena thermophila SB210]EAS01246.2 hypothetical protein TTHERM_00147570 [Tetrahymena thermophila SB210]|eukprot:XP_001021491.2 hypothetical protein TTHERM_00147570 [Tetrahymena thermophila SB210]